MAIGVFIENRDMGSLVAEMQDRVNKEVKLPKGYYITWGGEFENQQRAMKRLALIVPVSVFLIFALLFNAFGSAKNAALILMNVPFALIGGIYAVKLTYQSQRLRSNRFHCPVWPGGPERRGHGELL
jgi:cobalt-zinc-cadmium resistance protein CzcA